MAPLHKQRLIIKYTTYVRPGLVHSKLSAWKNMERVVRFATAVPQRGVVSENESAEFETSDKITIYAMK